MHAYMHTSTQWSKQIKFSKASTYPWSIFYCFDNKHSQQVINALDSESGLPITILLLLIWCVYEWLMHRHWVTSNQWLYNMLSFYHSFLCDYFGLCITFSEHSFSFTLTYLKKYICVSLLLKIMSPDVNLNKVSCDIIDPMVLVFFFLDS